MHALTCLALFTLLAPDAKAQDAVRVDITRKGLADGPPPGLFVRAQQALDDARVQLSCGALSVQHQGAIAAGDSVFLPIRAPLGAHACSGTLAIRLGDGSEGSMPLSFQVEVLPQLTASVPPDSLDLAAGQLRVQADRPLAGVSLVVHGEHGELARSEDAEAVDGGAIVRWSPPAEDVLRLDLTAVDQDGFAARVELFPWSYTVPHEDVVFATNQATIDAAELPKLEAAWARIEEVVARYGSVATMNLYVAGFTDTVGDAASNKRLSEARARSIAQWFRTRGFQGAIHFQGFGEAGLSVPTPDEVDEARNRRVDYIVAAQAPPESPQLPGSAWRPL